MKNEISAGIIIFRRTKEGVKFLLLYHGRGYWYFPKGKIEKEETSFQTAVREIREETGLGRMDLKFNQYFKTSEKFTFWPDKEKIFKIVVFYLAETIKKGIKISEEQVGQPQEGFGWFTYREAMGMLSKHKDVQRILTQANNFLHKRDSARASSFISQNTKKGQSSYVNNKPENRYHRPLHLNRSKFSKDGKF